MAKDPADIAIYWEYRLPHHVKIFSSFDHLHFKFFLRKVRPGVVFAEQKPQKEVGVLMSRVGILDAEAG